MEYLHGAVPDCLPTASLSSPWFTEWSECGYLLRDLGSHSDLSSGNRFSATFPAQLLNAFPLIDHLLNCSFVYLFMMRAPGLQN